MNAKYGWGLKKGKPSNCSKVTGCHPTFSEFVRSSLAKLIEKKLLKTQSSPKSDLAAGLMSPCFGCHVTSSSPCFGCHVTSSSPCFGCHVTSSSPCFGCHVTSSSPCFGCHVTSSSPCFGYHVTSSSPCFGCHVTSSLTTSFLLEQCTSLL